MGLPDLGNKRTQITGWKGWLQRAKNMHGAQSQYWRGL